MTAKQVVSLLYSYGLGANGTECLDGTMKARPKPFVGMCGFAGSCEDHVVLWIVFVPAGAKSLVGTLVLVVSASMQLAVCCCWGGERNLVCLSEGLLFVL